jgi:assimilatory nitrate reductase catalytic subunit
VATPDGAGGASISGDPEHPANAGRLCSKGNSLGDTLGLGTRLLHPMMRGRGRRLSRVSWKKALDRVAGEFLRIARTFGPDSVALYMSGQMLTEDYYVANKLMKGFIGSANIDANSRLCMSSAVAAQRRAFGTDTVPGCYDDFDCADLIVLVGSNAAWCHPILFHRIRRAQQTRGARLVVIDPRGTSTSAEADLTLAIGAGMDGALFSGLLVHLAEIGAIDRAFIGANTNNFEEALSAARAIAPSIAATAEICGLRQEDVARFFGWYAATARTVTAFSQGVNQSAQGTDKVNAIINCHLATHRIGRAGMGPFSITGQPNAMGGREVGALANQLAAHMDFAPENVDRVQRFWKAPRIATREGLKAVDLFDAVTDGRIRALWVMGTNPAVSLPNASKVRAALANIDFLAISENVASNDTLNCGADVVLPAAAWGEKFGTVSNSERRISRQRAFLPPAGEARPDWWILTEAARRMGFAREFSYRSPAEIFREHAELTAFENGGARNLNLGAFATITESDYQAFQPVQWPVSESQPQGSDRLFADGKFFHADGKARFIAIERPTIKTVTSDARPFRLNTGRIRDQWHSMTRTGLSPRLGQHLSEPFVEIHPEDANAWRLSPDGFAQLTSAYGQCVVKVILNERQSRGQVFVPIHWSGETSSDGRVGALIAPYTDPISGQPESKATPVAIGPVPYKLRGFILSRRPVKMPKGSWWARVAVAEGVGYLFASNNIVSSWQSYFSKITPSDDIVEYRDDTRRVLRAASFIDDRLELCLFLGRGDQARSWNALKGTLKMPALTANQRQVLLAGISLDGTADDGEIICACYGVTAKQVANYIARNPQADVGDIGERLKAGTGCGSCVPQIKQMIAAARNTRGNREAAE